MEVAKPWLYLKDVVVGPSTYLEDFRTHLLHVVRPEWRRKELDVKVFDSGITNTLVALYLKEKGLASSGGDVVLLRMNGTGSEMIIDRSDELYSMQLLHKAGLGPPIHAQLSNGLCYGFLPGRQMDLEEVRSEGIWQKVVGVMVALHAVEIPEYFQNRKPQVWAKIDQWLTAIPSRYKDSRKQKSFLSIFGSREVVLEEVAWLRSLLAPTKSLIAFCHNDTLIANFIVDQQTDSVHLVDYEYAGPNFIVFDIANHFCEYAGVDEVNYDRFPDEDFQKKWIRTYLHKKRAAACTGSEESSSADQLPSNEEVEAMFQDVTKFVLASHMFWTVWALLQTQYSVINFDYMEYACVRFQEYKKRKALLTAA